MLPVPHSCPQYQRKLLSIWQVVRDKFRQKMGDDSRVFLWYNISSTPLVSLSIVCPISSPSGLISLLRPVSPTSLLMVGGSGRRTGHLHPQSLSSTRCQAPLGLVAMMCSFGTRLKMVPFLLSLSYKGCMNCSQKLVANSIQLRFKVSYRIIHFSLQLDKCRENFDFILRHISQLFIPIFVGDDANFHS